MFEQSFFVLGLWSCQYNAYTAFTLAKNVSARHRLFCQGNACLTVLCCAEPPCRSELTWDGTTRHQKFGGVNESKLKLAMLVLKKNLLLGL